MSIETTAADEVTVLAQLGEMLRELLEEYGLDGEDDEEDAAEITMDTTFHDDLELESVDLVALSGQLRERYGDRVNFATFIAERDLDEIIALTVGELVRYIVASLRATA
ncbi:phosphopantetheine-binding protein [Amycolatopsis sp. A133]|uniref:acyl carrier protein n=1 Tax=Amycolatopsis sp. A133 TaxID=3064472 RepID=UPI0027EAA574|nr:phosphopantetheine-binding protein [Amycolatopsis sp. A133]MDQ7804608.1 phosphopantetheine-binding protein [Amycolatopsis sp. A133]